MLKWSNYLEFVVVLNVLMIFQSEGEIDTVLTRES